MAGIGFTGPFGFGKTYLAVRYAIALTMLDRRKLLTIEEWKKEQMRSEKRLLKGKPVSMEHVFNSGLKPAEDGIHMALPNGVALDGSPCPRTIVSDTPLNDAQLAHFGLPAHRHWQEFSELREVQDAVIVSDEASFRLEPRGSGDKPLNSDAKTKWLQQRKDDLDFALTFQLPRLIDVIWRELCQLGIWWVEPAISSFNWLHPERMRPDVVNPRTGRLVREGDAGGGFWGSATAFRLLRVDLAEFAKARQDWRIEEERLVWFSPQVATAYDTNAKIVVPGKFRPEKPPKEAHAGSSDVSGRQVGMEDFVRSLKK